MKIKAAFVHIDNKKADLKKTATPAVARSLSLAEEIAKDIINGSFNETKYLIIGGSRNIQIEDGRVIRRSITGNAMRALVSKHLEYLAYGRGHFLASQEGVNSFNFESFRAELMETSAKIKEIVSIEDDLQRDFLSDYIGVSDPTNLQENHRKFLTSTQRLFTSRSGFSNIKVLLNYMRTFVNDKIDSVTIVASPRMSFRLKTLLEVGLKQHEQSVGEIQTVQNTSFFPRKYTDRIIEYFFKHAEYPTIFRKEQFSEAVAAILLKVVGENRFYNIMEKQGEDASAEKRAQILFNEDGLPIGEMYKAA